MTGMTRLGLAWLSVALALAAAPGCRKTDPLAPLGAEELRSAGLAKMDAGKESDARKYFETMIVRAGTLAPEGTYLTGMSYFKQGLYEEAYARFEEVIDRYPASEWCDDAQYMKGESRLQAAPPLDKDQTKVDEALDEFTALVEEYEGSELVPKAQQGIAECRRLKAAKLLAVGKFYKKTGKYRAAAVYFQNVADDYPEFDGLAEAFFLAGESYAQAGDKDAAAESYNNLLSRFPESSYAASAAAKLAALEP